MTQSVSSLLAILVAAYPNAAIGEDTLVVYDRMLRDVDVRILQRVVYEHVAQSRFFPTVAEIREAVAEQELSLPSPADALSALSERLRAPEAGPPLHGLVGEALARCGGLWEARTSTQPQRWREQFLSVYRELRSQTIREAATETLSPVLAPAATAVHQLEARR